MMYIVYTKYKVTIVVILFVRKYTNTINTVYKGHARETHENGLYIHVQFISNNRSWGSAKVYNVASEVTLKAGLTVCRFVSESCASYHYNDHDPFCCSSYSSYSRDSFDDRKPMGMKSSLDRSDRPMFGSGPRRGPPHDSPPRRGRFIPLHVVFN